jgi:hypothetical protein
MIKQLTEFTPEQQDTIRKRYREYYINFEPNTNVRYIRVFGEDVDYQSIIDTNIILG